jgi:hypothetical protein
MSLKQLAAFRKWFESGSIVGERAPEMPDLLRMFFVTKGGQEGALSTGSPFP